MIRLLIILAMTAGNAHALTVPEALSRATGWPMPGHEGTQRAGDRRGAEPGGFHHVSGLGYVNRDRHDDWPRGDKPSAPDCPPPVPVPGAFWLFASAVAGISVIGRRK